MALFFALLFSLNYIGHLARFIIQAVKANKAEVPTSQMVLPALFWAIFYFLTF
jgi:hypothetical protein